MGSSKVPTPPAAPSAGENYESWIKAYSKYGKERLAAEKQDADLQMAIAREQIPQILALSKEYGPEYNQQQIDLEKQMQPQMLALANQTMAGKIQNAASLAPSLRAMADDPYSAAIRAQLGQQISGDLSKGGALTPDMQREIEQSIRAGQSARGMAQGGSAVAAEAFAKGSAGQALLRQRQAAATQFLQTQAQTQIDPWAAYTGQGTTRTSANFQAQLPTINGAGSLAPQAMAMNNAAALQNQQLAYNAQQANAKGNGLGGALGGAASGAAMGFMMGGPWGAAAGAVGGGAAGYMASR